MKRPSTALIINLKQMPNLQSTYRPISSQRSLDTSLLKNKYNEITSKIFPAKINKNQKQKENIKELNSGQKIKIVDLDFDKLKIKNALKQRNYSGKSLNNAKFLKIQRQLSSSIIKTCSTANVTKTESISDQQQYQFLQNNTMGQIIFLNQNSIEKNLLQTKLKIKNFQKKPNQSSQFEQVIDLSGIQNQKNQRFLDSIPDYEFQYNQKDVHIHIKQISTSNEYYTKKVQEKLCNKGLIKRNYTHADYKSSHTLRKLKQKQSANLQKKQNYFKQFNAISQNSEDLNLKQENINQFNLQDLDESFKQSNFNYKDLINDMIQLNKKQKLKKNQIVEIIQTDLNDNKEIENILESQVIFNEILNYITKLKSDFAKLVKGREIIFKKDKFDTQLKVKSSILSQQQLDYVMNEYSKKDPEQIDWGSIDKCCQQILFFKKYENEHVRINFLSQSKLIILQQNEIVYKRGDKEKYIYIILKGSVNLKTINKKKEEIKIMTLYDGQQFGESAMIQNSTQQEVDLSFTHDINANSLKHIRKQLVQYDNLAMYKEDLKKKGLRESEQIQLIKQMRAKFDTKDDSGDDLNQQSNQNDSNKFNRRLCTIECCETCVFLTILIEDFNKILFKLMQKELNTKIQLLKDVQIFNKYQPFALIPLGDIMQIEKYALNDIIIRQGTQINKLYIVSKGRLKILRIVEIIRKQDISEYAIKLKIRPRKFIFSQNTLQDNKIVPIFQKLVQSKRNLKNDNQLQNKDLEDKDYTKDLLLRNNKLQDTIQISNYAIRNHSVEGEIKYVKFEDYGKFSRGQMFGHRALTEVKQADSDDNSALLTVIAESNDVEIYSIQKKQLNQIPEFLQNFLIDQLKQQNEFDDLYLNNEEHRLFYWDEIKNDLFNDLMKQYAQSKNRPDYKEF